MTTHRDSELDIWKETCGEFIDKAQSVPELEATGKEIADTAGVIAASDADLKPIRSWSGFQRGSQFSLRSSGQAFKGIRWD